MVQLTQSLEHWLWENHKDIIGLVMLGHTELFTEEMQKSVFGMVQNRRRKTISKRW